MNFNKLLFHIERILNSLYLKQCFIIMKHWAQLKPTEAFGCRPTGAQQAPPGAEGPVGLADGNLPVPPEVDATRRHAREP